MNSKILKVLYFLAATAAAIAMIIPVAHGEESDHAQATEEVRCSQAIRRVALVIGNSRYELGTYEGKPLAHLNTPINDARAIAETLKKLGFEDENVILKLDVKVQEIGQIMSDFSDRVTPCSVAIFYYSGHGVSFDGDNYFPAINAHINSRFDVEQSSFRLSRLLKLMDEKGPQTRIIFLDACRENSYDLSFKNLPNSTAKGAPIGGLVPLQVPDGTEIVFATQSLNVAYEQKDAKFSVFTQALLRYLPIPDLTLDKIVRKVSIDVRAQTHKSQIPSHDGDLIDDFYFLRSAANQATTAAPSVAPRSKSTAALRVGASPDAIKLEPKGLAAVNYAFAETNGVDVKVETEKSDFFLEDGEQIGPIGKTTDIRGGAIQIGGNHHETYHAEVALPEEIALAAKSRNATTIQLRHIFNCRDSNGNELHIPTVLRIILQLTETDRRISQSERHEIGGKRVTIAPSSSNAKEQAVSSPSFEEVALTFENETGEPVDLFWINFSGKSVPYGSVPPHASRSIESYVGHLWIAKSDTGRVLLKYVVPAS